MLRNKFVKTLLAVLIVVFLFHQLYSSLYSPIKTETVSFEKVTNGIPVTGVFIRNETLISRSEGGVMHFGVTDGERVAKDGVIADIYMSEKDSMAVSRIAELKKQIQSIETIQGYNDLAAVDINLLNTKISDTLTSLLFSASSENFAQAREYKEELLTMMNRKEMVIGNQYDFSAQLSSLKSELASLEASLVSPVSSITAQSSGFFVSSTDGFENVLTTDDFSKYTPSFLESLTPDTVSTDGMVGKIAADYTWYIAVTLENDSAIQYKIGDSARLHTTLKNNTDLNVRVAYINKEEKDRTVIIFSCQEMNSELAAMRSTPMTVVLGEYQGLKISRSALRVVDNKTGVYVVSGMELKFIEVNVIYSEEELDYVICEKKAAADSSVLRLYDKAVVKGKNLYDGKIID